MHQATITVAYVNQPRAAGGKKGSIKDKEGRYFGVWADRLSQFVPGKTYDVEYTIEQWQGKDQYNIKSAILRGAALPPSNHNGAPPLNGDREKGIACHVRENNITRIAVALINGGSETNAAFITAAEAYDRHLRSGAVQ